MPPERLQKIIAAAGIASRRKAEELITGGLVTVNGQTVTELGSKADPAVDHIRVRGKLIQGSERKLYLMLNKPRGYVSTVHDPEGRATVIDIVRSVGARVFPIGRLDYNSEGLLLLTNDGGLAQRLTHASFHVPKTYLVKVSGKPPDEAIERLRAGVTIHEQHDRRTRQVRTAPARIELVRDAPNPWYEITLTEGRNRQIHRMFERIGHHVEKIRRVRYGPLQLDVEPGQFRALTPGEVKRLQSPARETRESRSAPQASQNRVRPAALGRSSGTQRRSDLPSRRPRRGQAPKRHERRPHTGQPPKHGHRPPVFGQQPGTEDRRPRQTPKSDDRRSNSRKRGMSDDRRTHPYPKSNDRRPSGQRPRSDDRHPRAGQAVKTKDQRHPGRRPKSDDRRPSHGQRPRSDDRHPRAGQAVKTKDQRRRRRP